MQGKSHERPGRNGGLGKRRERLRENGGQGNQPRRVEIDVLPKKLKDVRQMLEEVNIGDVSKYGDA